MDLWKKITDVTHDGQRTSSPAGRAIIAPLINHRHPCMNGMLFHCLFYPLIKIMSSQAVKAKQQQVFDIIDQTRKNSGAEGLIWLAFGVLFGFAGWSNFLHSDLTLNVKLFADKKHRGTYWLNPEPCSPSHLNTESRARTEIKELNATQF